ncbi:MAG TPA: class I SAM-dependent methyltransferase, partial [Thermoplasmata archaeon]|nr:class I SAM-dependent methyltransferase [Thermoplasmata archaeon]
MHAEVEFDRIAPVYDETRRPPSDAEVDALSELLEGCRTVLDAGVGTGRYAAPLHERRFDVLGVDLSVEMMRRARAKGIESLVRANVLNLPCPPQAVDGAIMAHVLQLLPDPRLPLRELGRVARRTVVVVLPEWSERAEGSPWHALGKRYRELAAELGYPMPARGPRYRHSLEDLCAIAPPREIRVVARPPRGDLTLGERLARWETHAYG